MFRSCAVSTYRSGQNVGTLSAATLHLQLLFTQARHAHPCRRQRPFHSGRRFSAKAFVPSRLSSVAMSSANPSALQLQALGHLRHQRPPGQALYPLPPLRSRWLSPCDEYCHLHQRDDGVHHCTDCTHRCKTCRLEKASLGHNETERLATPQSRRWQVLAAEAGGEGQPSTVWRPRQLPLALATGARSVSRGGL